MYPDWFHYLIGGLELVTALLLAVRPWRTIGAVLAICVVLSALLTLLWHGKYQIPPHA